MNAPAETVPAELLDRLKKVVGPRGWTTDPDELAPHLVEGRGLFQGRTPMLVRPATTEEVASVVALCAAHGTPVVPQGGNTGLCGGAVPHDDGTEILLALGRLNKIRAIDPVNATITVDAGCILAEVQRAAAEVDRLFPLSLGSEGSCTIGGNLSTNAGGTGVLRYGSARALVLGLEVVLPDGRVWDGLRGLRKDNTGYDLKQLFLGAEGTLGIITGAVLKLFPRPTEVVTGFVGLAGVAQAVELLERTRARVGDAVTGFELIARISLDFALRHGTGVRDPLAAPHAWYVLVEFSGNGQGNLGTAMEEVLAQAAGEGLIEDATVAASEAQSAALWHMRDILGEVQKPEGGSLKADVSVPISNIAEFIARADAAVSRALPGIRPVAFGHIGDGNIHYNMSQPEGADTDQFMAQWDRICGLVHDIVIELGGSISAEHGLGQLKREDVARYKSEVEMDLMRTLKQALDPRNIMNPGKVV